ncbi:MAG: hypothetical protein KGN33_09470 [Paracoccaceae bacterium]|nr:hypothetical protein [Paracoccaceae bacterium]
MPVSTQNPIPTLFAEWRELSRKLAVGDFAPHDFGRINDKRIEVENAIAAIRPCSLEELAQKCIIAGGSEDVEVLPSTILANDAMALLGVAGRIEQLFGEWVAVNHRLPGLADTTARERTLAAIRDLEGQILAAPVQSSLDAFRKVVVVMDAVPAPDDNGKDALLIREAYAALGLPLVPVGSGAAPQMAE